MPAIPFERTWRSSRTSTQTISFSVVRPSTYQPSQAIHLFLHVFKKQGKLYSHKWIQEITSSIKIILWSHFLQDKQDLLSSILLLKLDSQIQKTKKIHSGLWVHTRQCTVIHFYVSRHSGSSWNKIAITRIDSINEHCKRIFYVTFSCWICRRMLRTSPEASSFTIAWR